MKQTQDKVVEDILQRAGFKGQEYLRNGHPDVFFRDGIRREIKAATDKLNPDQRLELEWMTDLGQPWEILQAADRAKDSPILVFRNLQIYDLYHAYRQISCDWTQRVLPLGSVLEQRVAFKTGTYYAGTNKRRTDLRIRCAGCDNTDTWRILDVARRTYPKWFCKDCSIKRRTQYAHITRMAKTPEQRRISALKGHCTRRMLLGKFCTCGQHCLGNRVLTEKI
jgi:hypothetical protein